MYVKIQVKEVIALALSYNNLWKLLIDRKIKKTDLMRMAGLSPNTLAKLGKDEIVDMQSLLKICDTLICNLSDIVEYIPDAEGEGKGVETNVTGV